MFNGYSNVTSPSLNGLNSIDADQINTTSITSTNTDTETLSINGVDINNTINQVESNTTSIATINNQLVVVNNNISTNTNSITTNTNNITTLQQKTQAISYTSTPIAKTTINGAIETNSTFYIREPSDPNNIYMTIKYEPSSYGFCFTDESGGGRIMNFKVKNASGVGYKTFYFASSQLYANMLTYIDNNLTVSYNNKIILGDANTSVWFGSSISYIPNTAVTSGLVFYNKASNNGQVYYTNFTHNNLSNVETPTLRMNYNNIWSKVKHTFENGIDITSGNMTLLGNLIVNSTTITPIQLSYLDGSTSNIQTQLNNKLNLVGGIISGSLDVNGTTNLQTTNIGGTLTCLSYSYFSNDINLSGSAKIYVNGVIGITQNELSYLSGSTSNIQTQLNNKLNLSGGIISGNLNITGNLIVNSLTITPVELSYISGATSNIQTALNNKASLSTLNTFNLTNTFSANIHVGGTANLSTLNVTGNELLGGNLTINGASGTNKIYGMSKFYGFTYMENRLLCSENIEVTGNISAANLNIGFNTTLNGNIIVNSTTITPIELSYIDGITSNIQTQLNNKASLSTNTFTGTNTFPSISFTNGTTQTNAFNATTCGYTLSLNTLTFPSNTVLNCAVGGIGNEIKCHKFNCYNLIEFPDVTQQFTAYTNALNTKLTSIGGITIASLTTSTLTSGVNYNCGSMSLSPGTYILTINCCIFTINGSTTINQMATTHSTSPIVLTTNENLAIRNGLGATWGISLQEVLATSAIVSPTTTTTYYMICSVGFGTAGRVQFNNGNSSFKAVRIA